MFQLFERHVDFWYEGSIPFAPLGLLSQRFRRRSVTNPLHSEPSTALTRRQILRTIGLGATGLVLSGPALAACSPGSGSVGGGGTTTKIKIGFVSPRTGPAAGFGEPDGYVLGLARNAFASGLTINGKKYDIQIVDKDCQSDPQRASQVANDLINTEGVDLMLTTSTPETVNPVSDA